MTDTPQGSPFVRLARIRTARRRRPRLLLACLGLAGTLPIGCGPVPDDAAEAGAVVMTQQALQSGWLWPLAGVQNRDWVINNYVDLDPSPGRRDYLGGDLTYDGHPGVDIDVASFRQMDADVPVLAVTGGQVHFLVEDQPDRNLVCGGSWNTVAVRSSDGTVVEYGHLKQNSVVVNVGQQVAAGQKLAVVGSSGCSSQPHLHLQVFGPDGNLQDPFERGFWASPPTYRTAVRLMDLMVSDTPRTRLDIFDPRPNVPKLVRGSPLAFFAHTGGGVNGDSVAGRVLRPNGSQFGAFTHVIGPSFSNSQGHWVYDWPSGGSFPANLESNATLGTWKIEIRTNGSLVRTQTFSVVAGRSFNDTFSDGDISDWSQGGGSWSVSVGDEITGDGEYRAIKQAAFAGPARAWLGAVPAFTDQIVRARARAFNLASAFSSVGLLGRVRDANNYYQVDLVGQGGPALARILRISGGGPTLLASAPTTVFPNTIYDLRFEAVGTALRFFVNNTLLVSTTDGAHPSGTMGVATIDASASFGQIKISTPVP
jgi:hypothetical protein